MWTSVARRAVAAALLASATLLTGCSFHAETGTAQSIPKDKLAKTVKQRLEATNGKRIGSVTCDGDLRAKVKATQRCTLFLGDTKQGATVTTTSVHGNDVGLHIDVDKKTQPA